MLEIKQIEPEATYEMRHQVLRPNQKIEDCKYEADYEENSFHLGAFHNGKLISIASFYHEKNECFQERNQYRLRGMATLLGYRNQRAGSSLIVHAEKLMREKSARLWWCNARTSVSDYYKKLGLIEYGQEFDIHPIGPHKLMVKKL